jgi:hypothetical protein
MVLRLASSPQVARSSSSLLNPLAPGSRGALPLADFRKPLSSGPPISSRSGQLKIVAN